MLMMMEADNRGPVFPNIHIRKCSPGWIDTSDENPNVGKIRIVILHFSKPGKRWRISEIEKIDLSINQAHQHRPSGSDNNILSRFVRNTIKDSVFSLFSEYEQGN